MSHIPVLLAESLTALNIRPDGIYVDGTLGRAGHAAAIAERLKTGRLIGIDQDETAIGAAKERLAEFGERITLVHGNFRALAAILDELEISSVDGMLFDLGVSSPQLDDAGRGFSYSTDAPLDMRMNQTAELTAREVVNGWGFEELRQILFEYGEERYANRIAREIVQTRETAPIETTRQLTEIIIRAQPKAAKFEKQHPAKRSFQAIRIAVNDELGAIAELLKSAIGRLASGGRLAVISFHSLEDRLVKNAIAKGVKGCSCPRDFPVCVCGFVPSLCAVTKKPIIASKTEVEKNPRARSAKLRVAERI